MLGRSLLKWMQHSNITIAFDWDIKQQIEETYGLLDECF